jgi:hypothetical protein
MPILAIVPAAKSEVPAQSSVAAQEPAAAPEPPLPYESFVREVGDHHVGELMLSGRDDMRAIKASIRRAADRLGLELNIWDISGNIYFRAPGPKLGRLSRFA